MFLADIFQEFCSMKMFGVCLKRMAGCEQRAPRVGSFYYMNRGVKNNHRPTKNSCKANCSDSYHEQPDLADTCLRIHRG